MVEIVAIRFKDVGKMYYFSPGEIQFQQGQFAIVETSRGVECGEVVISNREVPESEIIPPLKEVIRIATEEDLKKVQENKEREKNARLICDEKKKTLINISQSSFGSVCC